jgi:predicted dehydrogenase
MDPVNVGIIGCGNICDLYFEAGKKFDILNITACADILPERAALKAEEHGIPKACAVDELLADPSIDIVINLTIPAAHGDIAIRALEAGKCVHNEKPLTVSREDGQRILALAEEKNLRVGCAPDTFMGAGIQTCRKIIDDGWIGEPVAATAFMMGHGHEHWHPNPDFFYQPGAGPMFDMGPYYLTALVSLIGPVRRVSGSARATFAERTVTSDEGHFGETIEVNTSTHIAGIMDFANGAIGTIITSFDVWAHTLPHIEIHGTEGSLSVPDPNCFGGPVQVRRGRAEVWSEMPLSHPYADQSRGIGVADMAYGLRTGRPHRANGQMAYHVLDLMHAFHDASARGTSVKMKSRMKRPVAVPMGLCEGLLDE